MKSAQIVQFVTKTVRNRTKRRHSGAERYIAKRRVSGGAERYIAKRCGAPAVQEGA